MNTFEAPPLQMAPFAPEARGMTPQSNENAHPVFLGAPQIAGRQAAARSRRGDPAAMSSSARARASRTRRAGRGAGSHQRDDELVQAASWRRNRARRQPQRDADGVAATSRAGRAREPVPGRGVAGERAAGTGRGAGPGVTWGLRRCAGDTARTPRHRRRRARAGERARGATAQRTEPRRGRGPSGHLDTGCSCGDMAGAGA